MGKQNKALVLGLLAAVTVFAAAHWLLIGANWNNRAKALAEAGDERQQWEKFFKPGNQLLPRPEAVKALNESGEKLRLQFAELQKAELGTAEQLHAFTEAAAGSGDHNNYFTTLQKQLRDKARDAAVAIPPDLGFTDKVLADDPVSLNLLRLAMIDRLLAACKEAGIPQIVQMRFESARPVNWPFEEEAQPEPKKKPGRDAGKDAAPKAPADRLVQIPMRVLVSAPERNVGQLLCEVQRPTENTRSYFAVRGFHVAVRTAGSGKVEAAVALAALLNEKTLADMGVVLKAPQTEDRRNFREYDER